MTQTGLRRSSSPNVLIIKSSHRLLTATTVTLLACSAVAQDNPVSRPLPATHGQNHRPGSSQPKSYGPAIKASDLIGMTVNTYQEEKLGKVEEVGVDVESGRIVQVIVSSGGLFGVGSRLTAVPPSALHHDAALKVVHLDTDKEKLKAAPEFDATKWALHSDVEHLTSAYRYHGRESELGFISLDGVLREDRRTNALGTVKVLPSGAPNTLGRPTVRNADGSGSRENLGEVERSMLP
jgi:hypothetical protein